MNGGGIAHNFFVKFYYKNETEDGKGRHKKSFAF